MIMRYNPHPRLNRSDVKDTRLHDVDVGLKADDRERQILHLVSGVEYLVFLALHLLLRVNERKRG